MEAATGEEAPVETECEMHTQVESSLKMEIAEKQPEPAKRNSVSSSIESDKSSTAMKGKHCRQGGSERLTVCLDVPLGKAVIDNFRCRFVTLFWKVCLVPRHGFLVTVDKRLTDYGMNVFIANLSFFVSVQVAATIPCFSHRRLLRHQYGVTSNVISVMKQSRWLHNKFAL